MYEYIKGLLVELNPAEAVIETGGIGYKFLISLQTFSSIEGMVGQETKLFVHHHLREDDESIYGFFDKEERSVFELLITVSGVGTGSARMILSSLSSEELQTAIIGNDVNKIKSIKGIGIKTAQRIILDLKDKIVSGEANKHADTLPINANPARTEAASALILLGFSKTNVDKALDAVCKTFPDSTLEELIKKCLKLL